MLTKLPSSFATGCSPCWKWNWDEDSGPESQNGGSLGTETPSFWPIFHLRYPTHKLSGKELATGSELKYQAWSPTFHQQKHHISFFCILMSQNGSLKTSHQRIGINRTPFEAFNFLTSVSTLSPRRVGRWWFSMLSSCQHLLKQSKFGVLCGRICTEAQDIKRWTEEKLVPEMSGCSSWFLCMDLLSTRLPTRRRALPRRSRLGWTLQPVLGNCMWGWWDYGIETPEISPSKEWRVAGGTWFSWVVKINVWKLKDIFLMHQNDILVWNHLKTAPDYRVAASLNIKLERALWKPSAWKRCRTSWMGLGSRSASQISKRLLSWLLVTSDFLPSWLCARFISHRPLELRQLRDLGKTRCISSRISGEASESQKFCPSARLVACGFERRGMAQKTEISIAWVLANLGGFLKQFLISLHFWAIPMSVVAKFWGQKTPSGVPTKWSNWLDYKANTWRNSTVYTVKFIHSPSELPASDEWALGTPPSHSYDMTRVNIISKDIHHKDAKIPQPCGLRENSSNVERQNELTLWSHSESRVANCFLHWICLINQGWPVLSKSHPRGTAKCILSGWWTNVNLWLFGSIFVFPPPKWKAFCGTYPSVWECSNPPISDWTCAANC